MACLVTILAGFSAVLGTQTAASGMMLVSQGYVATYTAYRYDMTGVSPSERATARACRTGILRHTWGIALPSCDTQGVSQPRFAIQQSYRRWQASILSSRPVWLAMPG